MALFVPPNARASDANNAPLSGAKWYFYLTDSTTPADVYTTAALAVAHTNPVVADSAGLFAAIYLDPAITYRAVLKTSAGSTILDIDPYNVADAAPQPGIFGVVGDDTADDTAALQAWIDYCGDNGLDVVCNLTLSCKTTDTVTFPGNTHIDIERISTRYTGSRDRPVYVVPQTPRTLNKTLRIGNVEANTIDWSDEDFVGVQLNDLYGCRVYLSQTTGFGHGYECVSTLAGFAYNEIHPGSMWDNKIDEVLRTAGNGTADFINENKFIGGNYSQTSNVNGLGNGYGTKLTWDGVASYRGHNNNSWINPCYELGAPGGATYRVPMWFDEVGSHNYVRLARQETCKGPFAILDGGGSAIRASFNRFEFGYNNIAGTQYSGLLEVNSANSNVCEGEGTAVHVWRSGPLSRLLYSAGGADAPAITGDLFFMDGNTGNPTRALAGAGQAATCRDAIQLGVPGSDGAGIFVAIDTTRIKTFRVTPFAKTGFAGRFVVCAFDSTGTRLTGNATDATWGDEPYVKAGFPPASSLTTGDDYGDCYITGSDNLAGEYWFTVRDEVKKIHVGFSSGTNPLAIEGIEIVGHAPPENGVSGADARGAMRVFADVDDSGTQMLATAKPDTAGTHGYYQRGQIVLNASAAAGQVAGWQCSTSGWLAAAWASTTAYAVLGRIVTNDSGKMYQLITAGTSAGSGGPTGTSTDITDGTCHWKYVGVKAVFVAMAVTS